MSEQEIEKVKDHIKGIAYSSKMNRDIDIKLAKAVKYFNKIGLDAKSFLFACENYQNSYCYRTARRIEEKGKELITEINSLKA